LLVESHSTLVVRQRQTFLGQLLALDRSRKKLNRRLWIIGFKARAARVCISSAIRADWCNDQQEKED
jgi:hypothetical protein